MKASDDGVAAPVFCYRFLLTLLATSYSYQAIIVSWALFNSLLLTMSTISMDFFFQSDVVTVAFVSSFHRGV
jgi:hypothetical protein